MEEIQFDEVLFLLKERKQRKGKRGMESLGYCTSYIEEIIVLYYLSMLYSCFSFFKF